VLGPYLSAGDVLGHEAMGVVTEVGPDVDTAGVLIEMTGGRGPDAVIDAVGMEAQRACGSRSRSCSVPSRIAIPAR
jgi:threonine dehydrogenase-like Zn-dependent dehydrogenase